MAVKYCVATPNKTEFTYLTRCWTGEEKVIYNAKSLHAFSFERAKRIIKKIQENNKTVNLGYQIFKVETQNKIF